MIFDVRAFLMSNARPLKMRSVKKVKKRSVPTQKLYATLWKLKSALPNTNRSAKQFIKNDAPPSMNWSALQVNNKKVKATSILHFLFRVYRDVPTILRGKCVPSHLWRGRVGR